MTRMMRVRMPALLAVCAAVLASGCSETPEDGVGDPVRAEESMPTIVEILDPDGRTVELIDLDESWNEEYPVRIVRKDLDGNILSEQILTEPPTLGDMVNLLTDVQLEQVEADLRSYSATEPDSDAAGALDLIQDLRKGGGVPR